MVKYSKIVTLFVVIKGLRKRVSLSCGRDLLPILPFSSREF